MPPKKPRLTHFLCLPLTTRSAAPQWQNSLEHFATDIRAMPSENGPSRTAFSSTLPTAIRPILMSAIRPLGTLHLTIGVMSLTKPEMVEAAVNLLSKLDIGSLLACAKVQEPGQDVDVTAAVPNTEHSESTSGPSVDEVLQPGRSSAPSPLILSFKGLQTMKSLKSASNLYTPPLDVTGRLYPFTEALRDRFVQEGLMVDEQRGLKLHATVLNTIYAGRKGYPEKRPEQIVKPGAGDQDDHHGSEEHYVGQHTNTGPDDDEHEAAPLIKHESDGKQQDQPAKKKGRRKKRAVNFDATELAARFSDYEWAREVRIERVAICEMGAKKIMDENGEVVDEAYTEVASVPLP